MQKYFFLVHRTANVHADNINPRRANFTRDHMCSNVQRLSVQEQCGYHFYSFHSRLLGLGLIPGFLVAKLRIKRNASKF